MRAGLACLLLAVATALSGGETAPLNPRFTGTPLLRVWRGEDYGAALLNTRVLVAPNGLVYVANNDGVLEFDGERWTLIPLPREGAARALALDATGHVWAFGHDDIARLEPDAQGQLKAVSRLEALPDAERAPGTINRAAVTADGVYARSQRGLMLFRPDGSVQLWPSASQAGLIWTLDGALYAEFDQLVRVTPAQLTPVPLGGDAAEAAGGPRVFATQAATDQPGTWLMLTMRGPMRWAGPGHPLEPLSAESAAPFTTDLASAGAFVADGRLALGTERSGLYHFDRNGRLVQHLTRENGLLGNRVNDLAVDEQGGLWIAQQEGLARLDLDSPFALHGAPQGLKGAPRRMAVWNGQLYLATSEGVARRDPATGRFADIGGFQVGANRPLPVGDRLVASTRGLREILPNDRSRAWTSELIGPITTLARAPGWIAAGASTGLWLIRPTTDGWETVGRVAALDRGLDDLLDTGDGWLWAVTRNGEVARVDWRDGPRLDATVKYFRADEGLPAAARNEHVQMLRIGDELLVICTGWIRRYDAAAGNFVPETRLTLKQLAVQGVYPATRSGAAGAWLRPARRPAWLLQVEPGAGTDWKLNEFSVAPLRGLTVDSMLEDPTTQTLWLAGQGTLASFDLTWKPAQPATPLPVSVRRIETGAGQVVYGGAGPAGPLVLAANQDDLKVSYAAQTFQGDYRGRDHTSYRTKLEGLDRDWSPWSTDTRRDFTNLPHEELRLHVQARTPAGRTGEAPVLVLRIVPPWWASGWAWAAYALLGAAAVTGYVRLRTRALRRRAAELEATIAARTEELRRSNLELVRLHGLELDEKIAARLAEEKARLEVLRYQLNPHFLFNALTSVCAQLPPGLTGARATLERLTDFCELTLLRPADGGHPTLDQEMKMLASYLDIEQSRWRDLLAVEISVDPAAAEQRIPSLLLLPLVENALKYGQATSGDKLTVRLTARCEADGAVVLEVANTGRWVTPAERGLAPSLGIGLENLRQRLQRYFPGAHEFTTTAADGWVVARVRLTAPPRA